LTYSVFVCWKRVGVNVCKEFGFLYGGRGGEREMVVLHAVCTLKEG
jgi:hypothetical protein